ncbi:hypothetical protein E2562_009648 [Oryza meyeriana var. granulata]|uniref:Uncharacterized protein n=1 Tax=Oryza meyeriana var. granulata TaxID=110450 RepID=A0A6G1D1K8_9ORYZ|nr:hypothetical protein E2562_009648 [Oryza meyeriana var. granulata]
MHFMLLGRDKVLATDQTGHAAMYDASAHAMCTTPMLTKPKNDPVFVAVGDDNLYVLDTSTRCSEEHRFEALVYERCIDPDNWYDNCYNDWRRHPLLPPPFRAIPGDVVRAYAVVGGVSAAPKVGVAGDEYDTPGGAGADAALLVGSTEYSTVKPSRSFGSPPPRVFQSQLAPSSNTTSCVTCTRRELGS